MTNRLLRLPDVADRVGLKRSSIYRMIASDQFPSPLKISSQVSAWPESEIEAWIQARIDEGRDRRNLQLAPEIPSA